MMEKKNMVAFDFDGTLTKKDTFVAFIKFSKGSLDFYTHLPVLLYYWGLFKFGLLSRHKAKEKIFGYFFKGMPITEFDAYCQKFAKVIDSLLRQNALTYINGYFEKEHTILIISASVENWIKPWAENHNINIVFATQITTDIEGYITGKFSTKNCHGKEKVRRLLEVYPLRKTYFLEAYGDSRGDFELLNFADRAFWNEIS